MSTDALKEMADYAEDQGFTVIHYWNERFDYLLEAVEVGGLYIENDDFENEFFDAKFDGGGNDADAERMWRE